MNTKRPVDPFKDIDPLTQKVDITNEEIKQGKTISQDQLFKDAQNW